MNYIQLNITIIVIIKIIVRVRAKTCITNIYVICDKVYSIIYTVNIQFIFNFNCNLFVGAMYKRSLIKH